jgi:hypothetical protein
MNTLTKAKIKIGGMLATAAAALAPAAFADPAIENDTLEGLPQVGSDLGDFLVNLAPGVGTFVLILGLFFGIIGIVVAIGILIKKAFGAMKWK